MSCFDLLNIILAFLALLLSGIAIFVSAKINRKNNRIILFEKRFSLLNMVSNFVNLCVNGKGVTVNDILKFKRDTQTAEFMLDNESKEKLKAIENSAWVIETALCNIKAIEEKNNDKLLKERIAINQARSDIRDHFSGFSNLLKPEMKLIDKE